MLRTVGSGMWCFDLIMRLSHTTSMARIINIQEAKTHLSRLLEQVHAGEEIILAKAGRPYARLSPLPRPVPQRVPGRVKGAVDERFFEPLDDAELDAWEGPAGR